jgi:CRISPR/Cas system CSM-associated protein Csm3 (group 7 of RAMP superfamily)
MSTYTLRFILERDATFGRGDGVAGVVDAEVQHDEYGCPYLGGRSLKGLLVNECSDIWAALPENVRYRWEKSAQRLFGNPGSGLDDGASLIIGDAQLPADLRSAIIQDIQRAKMACRNEAERKQIEAKMREDVLESITALRNQTSIDETGVAKEHTLRTIRVILRKTPFEAELHFKRGHSEDELALLAACIKAFRRAGTARNRGRGLLSAEMLDASGQIITEKYFAIFREGITL